MVFLRGLAQILRMEMLFDLFPDGPLGLIPHRRHRGQQHAVAGGLRDVQMEAAVGLFVGGLVHHLLAHRRQRFEDAVQVRVVAGRGCQRGDFGFDQATRAQQLERSRASFLGGRQAGDAGLGLTDVDARPAAHFHDPLQLQCDDGFAQRGAADVETLGQRTFGRQALADGEFALRHQGLDLGGQPHIGAVRHRLAGRFFGFGDQLQCHGS
ncbi:hypothetical protein G6F57_013891 [Rhizopus arrhizus]|nr:hypothetical protein G6F57_013891 [Rhizopus arrhizus]